MERIPALSICQPWAWAIIAGHKRIENRTWHTKYRGPLAIHASKSRGWLKAIPELQAAGFAVPPLPDKSGDQPEPLIFGALLGVVELVDIVKYNQVSDDWFAMGPLCWKVENPCMLPEPIPYRGQASLFYVDREPFESLL